MFTQILRILAENYGNYTRENDNTVIIAYNTLVYGKIVHINDRLLVYAMSPEANTDTSYAGQVLIHEYELLPDKKPAWYAEDIISHLRQHLVQNREKYRRIKENPPVISFIREIVQDELLIVRTNSVDFKYHCRFWNTPTGHVLVTAGKYLTEIALVYQDKEDNGLAKSLLELDDNWVFKIRRNAEGYYYQAHLKLLEQKLPVLSLKIVWPEVKKLTLAKRIFVDYLTNS